ncbi:MAG: ABC transporter ATP-binding protein [Acidimicrobiia bacterium]|nr:ABC transporter ATP-binding protein [Acidimicrobiia bacterium]
MTALLEVSGLSVRYGGVAALRDVDLSVAAGTVTGLIGPNGAGKTTFIDVITGFAPATTGRIVFDGRRIDGLAPHRRARLGLVRTFQTLQLLDELTVRENVLAAAERGPWWAVLPDLVRPVREGARDRVDRLLAGLGLEAVGHEVVAELPHGRRKVVAIARALAADPRLLVLDEPAAGLDPQERTGLASTLRVLVDEGVTVVLVDHDMGLVLRVCDTIWVLDFGSVVAHGPPDRVREDPRVVKAYLGHGVDGMAGGVAT